MSKARDYAGKLALKKTFSAIGVIGNEVYEALDAKTLMLVVKNVGVTNTVVVKGRIKGDSTWSTLETQTSVTTGLGNDIDISKVDELQFSCGVYDASGIPEIIVSTFFN